jgi:thioredoxin reductase (NADPH)
MSDYLIRQIEASPNVSIRFGVEVSGVAGDDRLRAVHISNKDEGTQAILPAAGLFVLIGSEPHTDWLGDTIVRDDWGFIVTGPDASDPGGPDVDRSRSPYESNMPGVYAVGDVRRGSVKRVASAIGEGAVVVSDVHRYLASQ